jgi:hypothetical protein
MFQSASIQFVKKSGFATTGWSSEEDKIAYIDHTESESEDPLVTIIAEN